MPPGGGVGITSLNRETNLDELIEEVRRRKLAGMPKLGKCSMIEPHMQKSKDAAIRKAYPHLFFDSQRHIDKVREYKVTNPNYHPRLKPSMSCPNISTISGACAGTSTYIDLLKKQWGMV
mmetsp:Transcript_116517/g.370592  ORF Transcript_116517/g.370592 Transcript_116517/m.370592 type:complete len:120 (+) Transcript_116517:67-426(+)